MKLTKTLGALACASALAFATAMPAFASSLPTVGAATSLNGGSGATEVDGFATKNQIVATIPMVATVFMPLKTGSFTATPNESIYCIDNVGEVPIKVTNIVGTAVDDTQFALVDGPASTGVSNNQVYMTITPQGGQTFNVKKDAAADATTHMVTNGPGKVFQSGTDDFGIPARTAQGLKINGGINIPSGADLNEANTYKLVNVTYTVAQG